jgi:hypothetical protein
LSLRKDGRGLAKRLTLWSQPKTANHREGSADMSHAEQGAWPVRAGDPTAKIALARMTAKPQFRDDTLAALRKSKGLRIRAGTGQHRFIGIWVVVVRDRVFVRSWSVKPNGWYRTFLDEPRGTIQVKDRKIAVRAIPIKGETLRDAIDRAYLDKYNTAWELKYAKDLGGAKSRDTTTEFVPQSSTN